VDNYGRELTAAVVQLNSGDTTASVRGDGAAQFVFAERGPRAVELSHDGHEWWVEFWGSEAVVMSHAFPSAEEAIQTVAAWLATNAEPGATPPA
jgi:hypothetical protein